MAEKDSAFDDEADQTMTLKEYLNGVEEDELEADLVLGGDEGKECTYNKGYMKRQAIFSCLTCTPAGNAGFCTACSLNCHDGHEIVELWTKRNFRCDCGNSKFGEFYCKLFPGKDAENTENSYNHNFKGLYCTCNRPYPDPDIEEQEDMMQCCICEDWFHEEHIGLESPHEVPKDQEGEPLYEDFICQTCSASCSFLTLYPKTIFAAGSKRSTTGSASKDKAVQNDASSASASGKLNNDINSAGSSESAPGVKSNMPCKVSEKNVGSSQGAELSSNETCIIGLDLGANVRSLERSKPMFLSKSWRDAICRCVNCVELYRVRCVSFLLDKEDSISVYMRMAEQKREEKLQQQEVAELSMLNNLGHVEKIEILNGIADIRDEFVSFLESSDPSKPVTPEDVQQVFENLNRKRRRV